MENKSGHTYSSEVFLPAPIPALYLLPLIAAVYFTTAWIGLEWSVETGIAAIIWPGSGIALASVLLYGYWVWPGVFLGSFCSNLVALEFFGSASNDSFDLLLVAILIAAGATLQALTGALLIRRYTRFPNLLSTLTQVMGFFLLAGPVSCLISAAVSTTVQVAFGFLPADAWAANALTWWGGDTLGSIIFAPIILVWGMRPNAVWARRRLPVTLALLSTFALTSGGYLYERSNEKDKALAEVKGVADDIHTVLALSLRSHLSALAILESGGEIVDEMTPKKFKVFANVILSNFPGIHALSWNVRFTNDQRKDVETIFARFYGEGVGITERTAEGRLVPARQRPEYSSVLLIEPFGSNFNALGFDVLSNPARRAALDRARDTGEMITTERIKLVQDSGTQAGVLVFRPHFHSDESAGSYDNGRSFFAGYFTAVYRIGDLVNSIFSGASLNGLTFQIQDLSAPLGSQLLYSSAVHGETSRNSSTSTPPSAIANTWSYELQVPDRQWLLTIEAPMDQLTLDQAIGGNDVLLPGILISILIGMLTLVMTGRQTELEVKVSERTRELADEMEARRSSEEKLRQSQKMEAVGQLTGGIAHDFNNILGIIMGNLELAAMQVKDLPSVDQKIDIAYRTSQRGAELTKKLLLFSRTQTSERKQVSVNDLINDMRDLLVKSLTVSIDIERHLADNLWSTRIDPSGFQDALLNLALNARDAMAQGGTLVIETGNTVLDASYVWQHPHVKAGEYVMLSVTDTGHGIPTEILDKVVEPFFSTKGDGKGTGLGMSMVYGFVQRSKGHMEIYSEVDKGTCIELYFPRSGEEKEEIADEPAATDLQRGSEMILVVDDEKELVGIAVAQLSSLGYRTRSSSDAAEALQIIRDDPEIDLLFTDVIMPGELDGYRLAVQCLDVRPDLRVLLTSGFTKNHEKQVAENSELHKRLSQNLLGKPYSRMELAVALRHALDQRYL